MTLKDKQILFTALGFLAILLKGKEEQKGSAQEAQLKAELIETFCRQEVPDAFPLMLEENENNSWSIYDLIIQKAKSEIKKNGEAELPESFDLRTMIYHRLQKRQRTFMTPALIADEINHLLNLETKHIRNEAKMMIANLEGDPSAFVPYERMANAIAAVLAVKEECFPSDLDSGFTDEEIRQHWGMAYGLAQVERLDA